MFVWTKQLSIGNRILDSEHKNLHDIVNKIACSILARDVAALSEAFNLLENRLCGYFVVEENIAQAVNFDFVQHKSMHQNLLNEFKRIRVELTVKNGRWSDDEGGHYAHFLMDYLIQHIKRDGRPLKIVLDTCLYDFNP
jgi:hemerythrin-like metal-binding protein